LSTSVVWNGIGGDNKINASEIATTALSGTATSKVDYLSVINNSFNGRVGISINCSGLLVKHIIVATDVAGNEAEKLITVSVKVVSLSTSVVWNGIGGDNKILGKL
jgi:hypothetical protein